MSLHLYLRRIWCLDWVLGNLRWRSLSLLPPGCMYDLCTVHTIMASGIIHLITPNHHVCPAAILLLVDGPQPKKDYIVVLVHLILCVLILLHACCAP